MQAAQKTQNARASQCALEPRETPMRLRQGPQICPDTNGQGAVYEEARGDPVARAEEPVQPSNRWLVGPETVLHGPQALTFTQSMRWRRAIVCSPDGVSCKGCQTGSLNIVCCKGLLRSLRPCSRYDE